MTHVSGSFVAKQERVFVKAGTEDWRVCLRAEAQEDQIIRCIHCNEPAARVDHFWPYSSEYNQCAFHAAPTGWGKMSHRAKWHWIEKGKFACTYDLSYSGRVLPGKEQPPQETICKRCHARIAAKSLATDKPGEEG